MIIPLCNTLFHSFCTCTARVVGSTTEWIGCYSIMSHACLMRDRSSDPVGQWELLTTLQAMLSSKGIMWVGLIFLEQLINFLLQKMPKKWIEQCSWSTWHCSRFPPQRPKVNESCNLYHEWIHSGKCLLPDLHCSCKWSSLCFIQSLRWPSYNTISNMQGNVVVWLKTQGNVGSLVKDTYGHHLSANKWLPTVPVDNYGGIFVFHCLVNDLWLFTAVYKMSI